jgi:hypothetical protein
LIEGLLKLSHFPPQEGQLSPVAPPSFWKASFQAPGGSLPVFRAGLSDGLQVVQLTLSQSPGKSLMESEEEPLRWLWLGVGVRSQAFRLAPAAPPPMAQGPSGDPEVIGHCLQIEHHGHQSPHAINDFRSQGGAAAGGHQGVPFL